MQTRDIDQKLDKMICVQNESSVVKAIAEEMAPLIAKQLEGAGPYDGVVLVMRSYPCKGTGRWRDFVSWQIVKE